MLKRFIFAGIVLVAVYLGFVSVRLTWFSQNPRKEPARQAAVQEPLNKVYSFSFAKYTTKGEKEIEIEGDSADIFARIVQLDNVIAKAYAEKTPVTLTADDGVFDKSTSKIHLQNNVVATSENGARLLTESLDIDPAKKTIQTDAVAQLKKDNIKLEGKGACGDSQMKNMQFRKNVTVVIENDQTRVPTVITCDGPLDVDYEKHTARFNNNVVATDERGRLSSDAMDVFYDKASRRVTKIVATGNVVIEQEGNTTFSDNVIYLAQEGRVILGGNPEAFYNLESGSKSVGENPLESFSFSAPSFPGEADRKSDQAPSPRSQ